MREYFAQVRRAGFDVGLSTGKLTKAIVEVLSQLPPEVTPSKEVVVRHLGLSFAKTPSDAMRELGRPRRLSWSQGLPARLRLDRGIGSSL